MKAPPEGWRRLLWWLFVEPVLWAIISTCVLFVAYWIVVIFYAAVAN